MTFRPVRLFLPGLLLVAAISERSQAAFTPITQAQFSTGSSVIDFTGVLLGTNVNGLSVGGLTFGVTSNGLQTSGVVISSGGPGVTDFTTPPHIEGTPIPTNMVLTVNLPTASFEFGYGYAVNTTGTVVDATTIELFNGATSLGTISYTANSSPLFSGGFAGVRSTDAFTSARITFAVPPATAFVVDNVTFTPASTVPAPTGMVLALTGICSAVGLIRRRRSNLAPQETVSC